MEDKGYIFSFKEKGFIFLLSFQSSAESSPSSSTSLSELFPRFLFKSFTKQKIACINSLIFCQTYFFMTLRQKNGDCNVLLNCLYQSIWLNIFIAQCLKYWACEPQIMSYKNLPGTLVHMYLIKFFKIMIFIQNCICFHLFYLHVYTSYASCYLIIVKKVSADLRNYFKVQ